MLHVPGEVLPVPLDASLAESDDRTMLLNINAKLVLGDIAQSRRMETHNHH